MKKYITLFLTVPLFLFGEKTEPVFIPVNHASFVMKTGGVTVFVDTVGTPAAYTGAGDPDIFLLTHTHRDHLDLDLINKLKKQDTILIGPEAVIKAAGFGKVLKNGESVTIKGILIKAVPMYNTTKDRLKFHPKGKGNGYLITSEGITTYVAGDTEDIPEIRKLKDINYAFICMNLPYTMTVEQAASAVLEMKPKIVFPYHYRGKNGMSDIEKFKKLVAADSSITVRFLDWYGK